MVFTHQTNRQQLIIVAQLHKLKEKVERKQRQISENLRKNRDSYWTEVAEQLETAYASKDMKRYYKLIKEAHGP